MSDKKVQSKPAPDEGFAIDSDKSQMLMPSITRLLNRKSLGEGPQPGQPPKPPVPPPMKTPAAPPPPPPAAVASEPKTEAPKEISLILESGTAPAAPAAAPSVQAAKRRERKPTPPLQAWRIQDFRGGTDPLGHAIGLCFDAGAYEGLFLSVQPLAPGQAVPLFLGLGAVSEKGGASPGKAPLWAGLQWNPSVVPDLWTYFLKSGFAELPPPGTQTDVASARNVARNAFGLASDEWLTLIRAGTSASCRGIVAVISKSSIRAAVEKALPLFGATAQKAA